MTAQANLPLRGIRVLVLEDDMLIGADLKIALEDMGVVPLGPFPRLDAAAECLRQQGADAALIDIDIGGQAAFPILPLLQERAIPFIFSTGIDAKLIPEEFESIPVLLKPFGAEQVQEWLRHTFVPGQGSALSPAAPVRNSVLQSLSESELGALRPHMSRVRLPVRTIVARRRASVQRLYFPETCLISVMTGERDAMVEVAVIGQSEFSGSCVLADLLSPYHSFVTHAGDAIAITSSAFSAAVKRSTRLCAAVIKHEALFQLQLASNCLALSTCSVEQRLARWLLMREARVGTQITVVHDALAHALMVRRPSITIAMQALQAKGAIANRRGSVIIKDKESLLAVAGNSYTSLENAQIMLFES